MRKLTDNPTGGQPGSRWLRRPLARLLNGRRGRSLIGLVMVCAFATWIACAAASSAQPRNGSHRSASGAAGPNAQPRADLSCSSETIYTLARGAGTPVTGSGVFGLATADVGAPDGIASTSVATMPGTTPNALGIGKDGTSMWALNQTGSGSTTSAYSWTPATGIWTTHTGAPTGGHNSQLVAGAVDPLNGLFYYAAFTGVGASGAELFALDISTGKPVGTGAIAHFRLWGSGTSGVNGDLAFDSSGNLFFVNGQTSGNSYVGSIPAADVPDHAPSGDAPQIDAKQITSFSSGGRSYNGIAFDNLGYLYLQSSADNVTYITKIQPDDGRTIAGPTKVNNVSSGVDLASCASPPTIELWKDLPDGRTHSDDQFHLAITGGNISGGNTVDTSGDKSGLQDQIAGPVIGFAGTTYTFSESMASGSASKNLGPYNTSAACVDEANSGDVLTPSAVTTDGTTASFTLTMPTSTPNAPAIRCTFTNAAQKPELTIVKSASPTTVTKVGETVTYTYVVKNTGNVALTDVAVHDDKPGLSAITCPTTQLAVDASMSCTATYTVTQADIERGEILNTATSSGTPPPTTNDKTPPPVVSPPSDAKVVAEQHPAIKLVKSADIESYAEPGTHVKYSYRVTNTGDVSLHDVHVTDPMDGLSEVKCPRTTLALNESMTCTATYTTTAKDVEDGWLNNTGTAHGTSPKDEKVTDDSHVRIPRISIALVKSANVTQITHAGQKVTYRYHVTNTGHATLDPVVVSDPMPGLSPISCPLTRLRPGHSQTCTATRRTTDADLRREHVDNTGTATGTGPGGRKVRAHSSVSIPVITARALRLTKRANAYLVSPGDNVTYTLVATNPNPHALTHVSVCDRLPAGEVYVSSRPAAHVSGESYCWTYTRIEGHGSRTMLITVNVTRRQPGTITNIATATADHVPPAHAKATIRVKRENISPCVVIAQRSTHAEPHFGFGTAAISSRDAGGRLRPNC